MKNINLHPKIKVILSDRFGGVSNQNYDSLNLALHVNDNILHVERNREIFASYFNTKVSNLVFMNQVHSDGIKVIENNQIHDTDAILTTNKNLVLCVMVADCAPNSLV